jgi:AcrR family transcriptional regulator
VAQGGDDRRRPGRGWRQGAPVDLRVSATWAIPPNVDMLAAATRLSAEQGWGAVSVRRVAEEAGTSTRAVFSLFGSKQGLDQELHLAMFERLLELMRATPRTADPRADLLELRHAYRRWATERPERHAAVMRVSGPHAARSPEGLATARAATAELRQVIARCAAAGLLADRDVDRLTVQWRAVAHGLAEFENRGLLPDGDQAWRSVLAALLDGYQGVSSGDA